MKKILPLIALFLIPALLKAEPTPESVSAGAMDVLTHTNGQALAQLQQDKAQKNDDDKRLFKLRDQVMAGNALSPEDAAWVAAKLGARAAQILSAQGGDALPTMLQSVETVAEKLRKKEAATDDEVLDAADSCDNVISALSSNINFYKDISATDPQMSTDMKICELELVLGLNRDRFLAAQKTISAAPAIAAAKPIEPTVVNSANYDAEVAQSKIPVFIDYYATWCGPCQRMSPVVASLAGRYAGKVKFVRIDVDQAKDLAIKAKIEAMPTFSLLKDGKEVWRQVGASPRSNLSSAINKALGQ
jgi:thioredoxin